MKSMHQKFEIEMTSDTPLIQLIQSYVKADPFYYVTGFVQADSAFCTEDETKPEWVRKLRKYQLELAEPGLRGANYIVTAPTGSGKTHVACYVIYEHLRKHGYYFWL